MFIFHQIFNKVIYLFIPLFVLINNPEIEKIYLLGQSPLFKFPLPLIQVVVICFIFYTLIYKKIYIFDLLYIILEKQNCSHTHTHTHMLPKNTNYFYLFFFF